MRHRDTTTAPAKAQHFNEFCTFPAWGKDLLMVYLEPRALQATLLSSEFRAKSTYKMSTSC